jgi:hypothetical protein
MRWILAAIVISCVPQFANAADALLEPDCPAPAGIQSTILLADLPASVSDILHEHVPNLAPADAPFNGGDVIIRPSQTRLDRRFLFAFHRGVRWTVAYEAAGMGTHDNVVAFQLSSDGQTAQVVANTQALGAEVCAQLARGVNPDYPVSRFW